MILMPAAHLRNNQPHESYHPAILDILPLTLEEIFIYEMGDRGYEIKNVLY